jgi:type IV secretion system protein VirB4
MAAQFAKEIGSEIPAADFIPYSSHVTRTVVRLSDGDYIVAMRLQGLAHETADVRDINSWHDQLCGFVRNIASPKVALWTHIVRREFWDYPGGRMPEGFCQELNDKYRGLMRSKKMFVNELYLTIVYRPQPLKVGRWFDKTVRKVDQWLVREPEVDLEQQQTEELESLDSLVDTALAALDKHEPHLLGCYEHKGVMCSELLEFLGYLINGEWRRYPLPRSEIKDVLPTSRAFFGNRGLMALQGPVHTQYGAMVTIQEYPSPTCPGILNDLLSLPFGLVLSQSFTFLSKTAALREMIIREGQMINADDLAVSQVSEIRDALNGLASSDFVAGTHSLSIMLLNTDKKRLNESISEVGAVLSDCGMKWAREGLGIAGAYWAQLPGNFQYRVRVGMITSRNFCGFASFHNYPQGRIRGNQWGDAVTLMQTTAGTPLFFSFHKGEEGGEARKAAKLDPNHKDNASTLLVGPAGTGKTVVLMMLVAQMQKFDQREQRLSCIIFDKDLGASIAVRAMRGQYFPLKNGVPTGFNPFQLEPTPKNLVFLEQLIKLLVKRDDRVITPQQEHQISRAIAGVMSSAVPKHQRRLSAVLQFFSADEEDGLHTRLARWCQGGPLGWLFDNEHDCLDLDKTAITGFDVTEFLENPETRTPTTLYLFHRIDNVFDGRRVAIIMDEGWRLLEDLHFQGLAKDKLATIRKQNGFVVICTQSPSHVLQSEVAATIVEQTVNKILLPNPAADKRDYVEGLKLTTREYEIVRDLGEKSRQFVVRQGRASVVAELSLPGFEDELAVLSGNTATARLVEELLEKQGSDPDAWLPEFHRIRKGAE